MKRLRMDGLWIKAGVSMVFAVVLVGSAFGQTERLTNTDAAAKNLPVLLAVEAQQTGPWTVGIDPAKNTVRLPNSATNPLPVTVVTGGTAGRRAFQARVFVAPTNEAVASAFLAIPAGKRLVIENAPRRETVTANLGHMTRVPGLQVEDWDRQRPTAPRSVAR